MILRMFELTRMEYGNAMVLLLLMSAFMVNHLVLKYFGAQIWATTLIITKFHARTIGIQTAPTVSSSCSRSNSFPHTNPFMLKFKTNLIKICQSCRSGYEGFNDTMGLVVARAERRMISNVSTGVHCTVSRTRE